MLDDIASVMHGELGFSVPQDQLHANPYRHRHRTSYGESEISTYNLIGLINNRLMANNNQQIPPSPNFLMEVIVNIPKQNPTRTELI
uniref:Uncharacterized protein n=1 Tax=Onchocerca volvulus TaxID=6282 RepID=A0A8R1Y3E0_ONCVO